MSTIRRRITGAVIALGTGAALVASASLLASAPASAATGARDVASPRATVGPTVDIVGRGIFNCGVATGEVGYSPHIISSGSTSTNEWYSIWLQATRCSGTLADPLPKTVIGALAFRARQGNTCPQFGLLGKGYMYFTYHYPPVPNRMIDPSVAFVSVTSLGAIWHIHGTMIAGSYRVAPYTFDIDIKPNLIGGHGCDNGGIDSEYIARLAAPFFVSRI